MKKLSNTELEQELERLSATERELSFEQQTIIAKKRIANRKSQTDRTNRYKEMEKYIPVLEEFLSKILGSFLVYKSQKFIPENYQDILMSRLSGEEKGILNKLDQQTRTFLNEMLLDAVKIKHGGI
ncbi:hypothetical protein LCGC14_0495200 [marine sediment metagenome]|uniref:Uncharacterized protein n=1 Tax=marine sediment metagenome TaxID=412755 RepID=A0A0F9VE61_9ZZZZ